MNDELIGALEAVDSLNSWVRSESFHRQWFGSSLRRVIYHFKRQAIVRAHAELPCEHGAFIHRTQCRDCRGTGRYTDCNGYTHPHCWACSNKGTVTLHFVETRIGRRRGELFPELVSDILVWHSPADKFPHNLPLNAEGHAGQNWTVNQPGRDITPEEAAGALNIAHEVFRDPIPNHWTSDSYDQYVTEDARYPLWIGEDEPHCAHCGIEVEPNTHRCGGTAGRVKFSFFVCDACRAALPTEQQYRVPVPKQLWGHGYGRPNINAWIVRQNAFAEKPKQRGYAIA